MLGGGGADEFLFTPGSDRDRVGDFEDGVDALDLSAFGFTRFGEVKALASDTAGGDLRLAFGNGDVLLVEGLTTAAFTAGDVIL